MIDKMEIDEGNTLWQKLGPYSCQLNVDEVDDIDNTWKSIAELIDEDLNTIKNTI
jgi:alanyl-tRNA synthetase